MRTVVLGRRPPELEALLERRRRLGLDLYDEVWEGELHMVPAPSTVWPSPGCWPRWCGLPGLAGSWSAAPPISAQEVIVADPLTAEVWVLGVSSGGAQQASSSALLGVTTEELQAALRP